MQRTALTELPVISGRCFAEIGAKCNYQAVTHPEPELPNLCIGIATPPVGSTLFVAARVARVPLAELTRPLLPMFALEILALFLITYFPVLSLWLPELILGKVS